MLNIAIGSIALAVAAFLLITLRGRDGMPNPVMLTTFGKAIPLTIVVLLVFGAGFIAHGLTAQ
jgi:hypothetical protein